MRVSRLFSCPKASLSLVLILCVGFDYCYFCWITLTSQWRLSLSWRSQLSVQGLSGMYSHPSLQSPAFMLQFCQWSLRTDAIAFHLLKEIRMVFQPFNNWLANCSSRWIAKITGASWNDTKQSVTGRQPETPVSSCWPREKSHWHVPF